MVHCKLLDTMTVFQGYRRAEYMALNVVHVVLEFHKLSLRYEWRAGPSQLAGTTLIFNLTLLYLLYG